MVEIKRRLQKIRDSVALFGYKVEVQQGELETFAIGIALGVLHWECPRQRVIAPRFGDYIREG
jgi:hypothetical protein